MKIAKALRVVPAISMVVAGLSAAQAASPPPVFLGKARDFVILTKSGITDVPGSSVVGNVGTSPITGAADHLTCTEVTGLIFAVDATAAAPCGRKAPSRLTTALGDMQTAYTNAARRAPDVTELGAGNIGGMTLKPGVYRWSSSLTIPTDLTLQGTSRGVWIFQVAQELSIASGTAVVLSGGAVAGHVFWQVAGKVTLATTSHFKGVILGKTMIAMRTGATIDGRLYAQTAVTLQKNTVTKPAM